MYNPCFECDLRYGHSYTSECDDRCDYAKTVRDLKLYQEELQRPVNTLGELAVRCCEMLECKNCPVHIHDVNVVTRYQKEMLHYPCCMNLYAWILDQVKAGANMSDVGYDEEERHEEYEM